MGNPSIKMTSPVWLGGNPIIGAVPYIPSSYSHSSNVSGGYDTCSFDIAISPADAALWFESVGNHIEVSGDGLDTVWEGFVDSVNIKFGKTEVVRGPLMDVVNRLTVTYSEVARSYDTTSYTVGGDTLYTPTYNDTASQARWGILESMLSAGSVYPGDIDYVPQAYVADNNRPPVSQSIDPSASSGALSVSVNCRGYGAWLERYLYTDLDDAYGTPTVTVTEKLADIIGDDPNGIFSTDYTKIATNATDITRYDDSYGTAKSAIEGVVKYGDASYNRYIWGVYNDRIFEYNAIPSTVEYIYDAAEEESVIRRLGGGGALEPWEIRPGRFVLINNLLPGAEFDGSVPLSDDRVMLIESVSYSAPYGLSISGGKFDTITQRINRFGLGSF
jgi:hypothetical protein